MKYKVDFIVFHSENQENIILNKGNVLSHDRNVYELLDMMESGYALKSDFKLNPGSLYYLPCELGQTVSW